MKKYSLSFLFKPLAFLLNIFVLNISIFISYFYKFNELESLFSPPYFLFFWFVNLSWVALLAISKPPNNSRISFNIPTLVFNYSKLIFLLFGFIALFWVSFKAYSYSRTVFFLSFFLTALLGYSWRILAVYVLRSYRSLGYNNRSYAILGKGELPSQISSYYKHSPELGFKEIGLFQTNLLESNQFSLKSLVDLCEQKKVDFVYICVPYLNIADITELIKISEKLPFEVKIISDFRGFLKNGLSVEYHGYLPVLNLSKKPYSDPRVELVKRLFDLSISIFVLIVLSPLFFIIAIITKITSRGTILYTQERIGRWGKPFQIFKFRSMYQNSEMNGPALSNGDVDKRITPWGRFMRKTRLDELPQFLNVILGNMSIVGPRPERQFFIDLIVIQAPEYSKLLTLKPGITSIGQIKFGYASSVAEMIKRMKYDLIYLKKYSLETDLMIVFLTAKVIFQGRGK